MKKRQNISTALNSIPRNLFSGLVVSLIALPLSLGLAMACDAPPISGVIASIAGGVLVNLDLSNWLLTFSVFFFLFLAAVKRWVELKKMKSDNVPGRGYRFTDVSFVSQLSYFAGLISILVICLYIESQQARELYEASQF